MIMLSMYYDPFYFERRRMDDKVFNSHTLAQECVSVYRELICRYIYCTSKWTSCL